MTQTHHFHKVGSVLILLILIVVVDFDGPVDVDVLDGALVGEADVKKRVGVRVAVARDARCRRLRSGI